MGDKEEKPLKKARSQAELTRTRNSNILLLYATITTITNVLVALKVFGLI